MEKSGVIPVKNPFGNEDNTLRSRLIHCTSESEYPKRGTTWAEFYAMLYYFMGKAADKKNFSFTFYMDCFYASKAFSEMEKDLRNEGFHVDPHESGMGGIDRNILWIPERSSFDCYRKYTVRWEQNTKGKCKEMYERSVSFTDETKTNRLYTEVLHTLYRAAKSTKGGCVIYMEKVCAEVFENGLRKKLEDTGGMTISRLGEVSIRYTLHPYIVSFSGDRNSKYVEYEFWWM